jgi:hypothetical protein
MSCIAGQHARLSLMESLVVVAVLVLVLVANFDGPASGTTKAAASTPFEKMSARTLAPATAEKTLSSKTVE